MTAKHVYAYTQTDAKSYPGYISLNVPADSKHVFITVRTPGSFGTQVASVPLPDDRLEELGNAILAHIAARRSGRET